MGLAVDYGAHIAHYFLTCDEETRNKRIELTLIEMGPAVFNGGFSTFLAFILLMTSKSYVFKTQSLFSKTVEQLMKQVIEIIKTVDTLISHHCF